MHQSGRKFGDNEYENPKDDGDVEKISESSCMQGNDFVHENAPNIPCEETPHSNDTFNSYEPLQKKNDNLPLSKDFEPTYPSGFALDIKNNNKGEGTYSTNNQAKSIPSKKHYTRRNVEASSQRTTSIPIVRGLILDVMDDLITALWDNLAFDHVVSPSVGNSGGILCTPSSIKLLVISMYAPQELTKKRELWGYICSLIDRWDGKTLILGLIDLPLGGYSYVWAPKSASKMSKLNRFLISEVLMALFPQLSGLCLDKHLFDHRPIIMCEPIIDYGPTLFHQGRGNEEVLNHWASLMKDLNDINSIDISDLSQKAKVCWSIEGDDNFKHFHGILNSKRSQIAIRGIPLDGD
ncbi:hypothetical protein Tco_0382293 [Tanacetum coccineum]